MNIVECWSLGLSYDGKQVVKDLSFAVEQGAFLCIVGENGTGKTTLLNSLLGLKKPDQGQVVLAPGVDRSHIGYLPQKTQVQMDFPATVEEIVFTGLLGRKKGMFESKREKQEVLAQMEALELIPLRKACFRELSGGQQQRVLLARALLAAKKMLILDEPATGLDPVVTGELYHIVKQKNREGLTVIMVSHDIENAIHTAGRILHLSNGEYFFGSTAEYVKSPLFRRFIGGGR